MNVNTRKFVISRLRNLVHKPSIVSAGGDEGSFVVLIRDGAELAKQPCSITRKRPTKWDGQKEQFAASIPIDSIYLAGLIDFNVMSGDVFHWDNKRWEVVEAGVIGLNSVARRVRAENRPS